MTGRQGAGGDELLAHLLQRLFLARERPLDAVADRDRHAARSRTSFRMPSGISENAWSVPFAAWLSVKCFSITRAPSMYATGAIAMPSWWSERPITSSG